MSGAPPRLSFSLALPLAMTLGMVAPGCLEYADTVQCSMGRVLDENDECVPPSTPDGGAGHNCASLCDALESADEARIQCFQTTFSMFGPPPATCMADLTERANCDACASTLALDAAACESIVSACP